VATDRGSAAKTDPAFRQWLRELRERAGLTQEQLAHAVGTDRRNIRRWEVDGHDPAGSMLMRVLDAVGVTLVPAPPSDLPRSVNAELRDLRARLREDADEAARRHDELRTLLDARRERVDGISARREELFPQRE
jgi:transcriptional regulator with XRE-family HTH domain